jgi:hypothetical protein
MYYRLVARDNIESHILEIWPPVLDQEFTLFNNRVIDIMFPSEIQIFNWLDSRSRAKHANKMTNTQKPKNGDPNKIYAVYFCDAEDEIDTLPIYLYSIKMIRPGEPQSIIMTGENERIKTSFKKYNMQKYDLLERIDPSDGSDNRELMEGSIIHSSKLREVHYKFFEGIYPISQELGVDSRSLNGSSEDTTIDSDEQLESRGLSTIQLPNKPYIRSITKDSSKPSKSKIKTLEVVQRTDKEILYEDYMQYVSAIHKLDTEQGRGIRNADENTDEKEYDVIFSDSSDKWLDHFVNKLDKIESYLRVLAKGGKGQFNLRYIGRSKAGGQHEIKRQNMISDIHRILESNVDMTRETSEDFRRISNLTSDPILFDGNVYQVRYGDTLLTWHAGYSQIIKDLRVIPSKSFCYYIILFEFSDFFKQNQPIETLEQIYEKLMSVYQVHAATDARRVHYVKSKNSRVRKVTRRF